MNSILQIVIQAVDQASEALSNIGNAISADGQKALTTQQQMQQMGQAMEQAGTRVLAMGAAADAFYGGAVLAAEKSQQAEASLAASVENLVKQSEASMGADSGAAQQKAFLTTKIQEAQASIAKLSSETEKSTQLAKDHGAANEANAAKIDALNQTVAKYQGQLDLLNNTQKLAGASAQSIISTFENLAEKNVALGFGIEDSVNALNGLFTETKSMPEAIQAYNAALDLSRFKHMDLETATKQVEMALQGQGRALATLGIQIKDGLTPMQALQALQEQVKGQAEAYADTLGGKTAVALQKINKLFEDMGKTQMPILTKLIGIFADIIDKIDQWVTAHPKLTAAIMVSIGVFGVLATIAGTLLITVGALVVIFGTAAAAVAGWAIAIIAAVAILAGIVTLIFEYHTQIWNFIQMIWQKITAWLGEQWTKITADFNQAWNAIKTLAKDVMDFVMSIITADVQIIGTAWNTAWSGISDFFTGIWNGIKNALQSAVSFITDQLNNLFSFVSNIAGKISAPIQSITSFVSSAASAAGRIGSSIGNAVSSVVPHFASGGIVNGPTYALVGEAGPEAIIPLSMLGRGGSTIGNNQSGSINVYLSGNFYTDQQNATRIGNMIAKVLNQQLKLKNY